MGKFQSTKTFDNYSVALRQAKAGHSHCQLLHGYALEFTCIFEPVDKTINDGLDDMNWVVDFGGFKSHDAEPTPGNGLKDWMNYMWDHTTLVENDDPYKDLFETMAMEGIMNVRIMDKLGAEANAKLVFDKFNDVLSKTDGGRCRCVSVTCNENEKNSGIYSATMEEILADENIST